MKRLLTSLAILLLISAISIAAQTTSLETMRAARELRQELSLSVSQGAQTSGKALATLRSTKGASGRAGSADADLAFAALDIGYRLMALERPDAAEDFFRAAAQSFAVELNRTTPAKERAQLLQQLALIRGRFLGKIDQAKADIDEAIRLQPSDTSLKETRALLARGHGEHFKN